MVCPRCAAPLVYLRQDGEDAGALVYLEFFKCVPCGQTFTPRQLKLPPEYCVLKQAEADGVCRTCGDRCILTHAASAD